jgi:hypothetical protein
VHPLDLLPRIVQMAVEVVRGPSSQDARASKATPTVPRYVLHFSFLTSQALDMNCDVRMSDKHRVCMYVQCCNISCYNQLQQLSKEPRWWPTPCFGLLHSTNNESKQIDLERILTPDMTRLEDSSRIVTGESLTRPFTISKAASTMLASVYRSKSVGGS